MPASPSASLLSRCACTWVSPAQLDAGRRRGQCRHRLWRHLRPVPGTPARCCCSPPRAPHSRQDLGCRRRCHVIRSAQAQGSFPAASATPTITTRRTGRWLSTSSPRLWWCPPLRPRAVAGPVLRGGRARQLPCRAAGHDPVLHPCSAPWPDGGQRRGRRRRGLHPPGQPPLRRPAAVECGDCSDRGHPLRAEARIGRPSGIEQAGRHLTTIMKRHEASRRRARQVPTRGGTPAASRAPGAREPAGEGTQVNRNALQSGPAASHGSEARGPPGWFTKPLCLLPPRGTTDRQVHADIKPRSRWWHSTHQRTLRVFVSQSNCTTASARQSRTVMAGKSGFMRHMLPPRAPASPGSASSPQPGSRMRCWCRSARILKTNSSRGQRPNCCPPSPRARRTDRGRGHSGRCKRPRAGHRRMWHRPGWAAPPISTMSRRRRAGALVPAPGLLTACSAAGSGR